MQKTLFISPSLMYREDLIALEDELRAIEADKRFELRVSTEVTGKDIRAISGQTLNSFLETEKLPEELNQLIIMLDEYGDGEEVVRNVRVNLDKRVSDIALTTQDDDKAWIKENGLRLKSFFKQRRPWYWFIGLSIPPVFNITLGISMIMAAFVFVSKVSLAILFPLMSIISGAAFMALGVKRVLFRHARICLFDRGKDNRPNYELLAVVFHITMLFFAIGGTVIMTVGKI